MTYQINCKNDGDNIVVVRSHYFTRTEAKEVYLKSKEIKRVIDDSIIIYFGKEGTSEDARMVSFGVEEGEKFALALLNLCQAIKY